MIIEGLSIIFIDNIVSGTGVGTNILEKSDLQIPGKTMVEITIKVRTIDAKVGGTYNQAFLYDIPERFDGNMRSDNLGITGVNGDHSLFSVDARELEDA